MQLAADDIVIRNGCHHVRLTPSLRAAIRLHRKHGLPALVRGLFEGNLTIFGDILQESGDASAAQTVLELKIQSHLGKTIAELREPLAQFLAHSFGIDTSDEAQTQRRKPGKALDMGKALESLFEIGTGWLGWSCRETLDATPAEILAAQRGLIAKLKAVHGSASEEDAEQPEYDPREEVSPEEVKAGLAKIKANMRRGKP